MGSSWTVCGAFCPHWIGLPGVPSCEVRACDRGRWVDTPSAAPRRLQRKPLVEDGKCHWDRTIHPVVIPGAGVTGACPKSVSCRSELILVCLPRERGERGAGAAGAHKNNSEHFICFFTFWLQTTWPAVPAGSRGPARAQSYGAALSALFVRNCQNVSTKW